MRKFHLFVHSILLITSPSLFAYPQYEQPAIQQVYNQEIPFDGFNLTYDDILNLLQDIEEGRIETLSEEKIDRISRFIAFLAQQGMLPGDYAVNAALENDIAALFDYENNFYDYAQFADSFDDYTILPALLNGEENATIFLCKHKHKHHHKHKDKHKHHHKHNFFAQVKHFVVKHKKAILIGAAIIIAATVVIVAVAASSSALAAAAGAAAAAATAPDSARKSNTKDQQDISSSNSVPTDISPDTHDLSALKSTIDHQIISFKENVVQNQFFQPTNPSIGQQELSWEENGRALGSLFAHDSYNSIQHELSSYPTFSREIQDINSYTHPISGWNESNVTGHSEIDRKFSTDFTHLYTHPSRKVDFETLSYQIRGESALAHGCYEQAAQDFGRAIEFNPTNPIPYLERGIANFGLGKYDQSIFDYQQFASQTQKTYPLSVPDFSLGFAKGLPKGLYESGRGIFVFLSDVITHPVHTGYQMWDALKLLSELACTEQWEALSEVLAPEVRQLVKEWETIPSDKRGELAGYAFGKYGADILVPGALAKTISKGVKGAQELSTVYRGLKAAEQTFLLESAAGLESSAKIAEVVHLEKQISNWLGENTQFIRNKAEDPVFLSKDGLRKVRFDFNRPDPHQSPHLHLEHLVDGEWKEISRVYPIDVPHK